MLGEALDAESHNWVGVGEEHDGQLGLRADLAHFLQHALEGGSRDQGSLGGTLVGGTIRHGIRERYSKLEDIGPGPFEGICELHRPLERRVAGRDIRYEGGPPIPLGILEGVGDPAHDCSLSNLATSSRSLSPRPERLTTILASRAIPEASLAAWAMAWADSRAGTMPSVSASR